MCSHQYSRLRVNNQNWLKEVTKVGERARIRRRLPDMVKLMGEAGVFTGMFACMRGGDDSQEVYTSR